MSIHAVLPVDPAIFHGRSHIIRYFNSTSEARSHAVAAARSSGKEKGRIAYYNDTSLIGSVSSNKTLTWLIREY